LLACGAFPPWPVARLAMERDDRSAAAWQALGNESFAKGDYREALSSYAAALAALDENAEKERAAALRSNRAQCCLKLGSFDLALAEAEKCRELRPDWPKAHFRMAAALQALGRLGDARLSACEAKRLAPKDREVDAALQAIRELIFEGAAAPVGEALDELENFEADPEETYATALELRNLLVDSSDGGVEGATREACIRAFVNGGGAATVFRRQNAMGTNWMEECRNGTMRFLSEISAAAPQLEQEVCRLNMEAEKRERGCNDGLPGCQERQGGKAGDSVAGKDHIPPKPKPVPGIPPSTERRHRNRKKVARSLSEACNFEELVRQDGETPDGGIDRAGSGGMNGGNGGTGLPAQAIADGSSRLGRKEPEKAGTGEENARLDGPCAPGIQSISHVAARLGSPSRCAKTRMFGQLPERVLQCICSFLPALGAQSTSAEAAAVNSKWAVAARAESRRGSDECASRLDSHWPGLAQLLSSEMCSVHIARSLSRQREAAHVPKGAAAFLSQWLFAIDVRREDRCLWSAAVGAAHALPAVLHCDQSASSTTDSGSHPAWPTFLERLDVALPGDLRRMAVAGTVAALQAIAEGQPSMGHTVHVTGVHATTQRLVTLPAVLAPGSRRSSESPAPALSDAGAPQPLLGVVIGLGTRPVMPQPHGAVQYPSGSYEVRTSMSFVGPDGGWLRGGALALVALLEALAAWS